MYAVCLDPAALEQADKLADAAESAALKAAKAAASGESNDKLEQAAKTATETAAAARGALPVVLTIGSTILGRTKTGFTDHAKQFANAMNSKDNKGLKSQKVTSRWCGVNGQTAENLFSLLGKKTTVGVIDQLLADLVVGAVAVDAAGGSSKGGKVTVESFLSGGW